MKLIKSWNDILALLLLGAIAGLWAMDALWGSKVNLPGEILGVTMATWTLVVQYYFRKAPPNGP